MLQRPTKSPTCSVGAAQADDLLAWYDRHARVLPWRARPGEPVDPYRVWLSEIMLQQTTVKAVSPYFARFLARWPDVGALAAAPLEEVLKLWAGLGYYARARNLHACAQVLARDGFPRSEDALMALPGIGRYTAAAIAAIAFDVRTVPVDGNVERVVTRLFAIEDELPAAKPRVHRLAQELAPAERAGDVAQALMDLGAILCTPLRPDCTRCPWAAVCAARRRGDAETFPRKAPKRQGRLRRGAAFVILRDDGCVLLRRRPTVGLLGGMTEVPTTAWSADFQPRRALDFAPMLLRRTLRWRRCAGTVRHGFTHFPLALTVYLAAVGRGARAPKGARWVPIAALAQEALPKVMRKVLEHALGRQTTAR
ncbi:MAG: A/G-specific adenine glycosylase [Hyphomicrobiales bacterium]|nr:A/G-specific adenine glycosylase [Hyphomicrobiales bacterium]